ncbi:HNH endonuclease [Halorientalis pallida]|uniref:HNH endonuclease n=1 Tax=Halorientalis pallida TaxID=2479928 RepID=A0A498L5J5_9EURY|nr:HNH endonuclease [Halorientalis pallida]
MHNCPECNEQFYSLHKLRVHHKSSHGESLPNRECDECGSRFFCEWERKYCSDSCRYENRSNEGENNPNYSGGKTETECEICGGTFEYYPSEKKGLYCPTCVESEDWRPKQDFSGVDNPRWNGGKQEYECDVCGDTVERYPGRVTGEIVACDKDCHRKWLSEAFTGEGHPNWEGGDTGNYGQGWNRSRKNALERDGYECTHCGKTREEIGRNPDVHHIVPVRVFAAARGFTKADAHYKENVVSLCIDCHRKADFGSIPKARLLSYVPAGTKYGPHVALPEGAGRVESGSRRAQRPENTVR